MPLRLCASESSQVAMTMPKATNTATSPARARTQPGCQAGSRSDPPSHASRSSCRQRYAPAGQEHTRVGSRLTGRNATSNPADMPTAHHGDVELFFEEFGSASDPVLALVNGLGSQCINYDEQWCEMFAARGYRVIRFDNRDTGLS